MPRSCQRPSTQSAPSYGFPGLKQWSYGKSQVSLMVKPVVELQETRKASTALAHVNVLVQTPAGGHTHSPEAVRSGHSISSGGGGL